MIMFHIKLQGCTLDDSKSLHEKLGCDIGGAKELRVIYFPTNWGAKEPQNLPNHRVENDFHPLKLQVGLRVPGSWWLPRCLKTFSTP